MITSILRTASKCCFLTGRSSFSEYKKLKKAFYDFLNYEAGAAVRNTPEQKDRKYKHVEIAKQFNEIQQKRKQQRLIHIQARKNLLERKLDTQIKMLSDGDKNEIQTELQELKNILEMQKEELQIIEKKLEQTQADMVLLTDWRKLSVLCKIEYLRYIEKHPSGLVFSPQTIKVIENVHYLVTNNLPVHRYKIYEISPELFATQIKQLDQAKKKLIEDKSLKFQKNLDSDLQHFMRKTDKQGDTKNILSPVSLQKQRQQVFHNMCSQIYNMFLKHQPIVQRILNGKTVYRNLKHCIYVLLSDTLNLTGLTDEEKSLQETLREADSMMRDFQMFKQTSIELEKRIQYSYEPPPPYIANHPILNLFYQRQLMPRYTNPLGSQAVLGPGQKVPQISQLKVQINKAVSEYFDPKFQQMINSSSSEEERNMKALAMNNKQGISQIKKIEIQFFRKSTEIMENLNALEAEQQDYFQKLPKEAPQKLKSQSYIRIKVDELVKMIKLNKDNPDTYNIDFFSKYFGIQRDLLSSVMDKFSYVKMNIPKELLKQHAKDPMSEKEGKKDVTRQIIKFGVEWRVL